MLRYLPFLLFFAFSIPVFGQDLVYRAKNPNFGGDTFNYQMLLSGAQAQNGFSNPTPLRTTTTTSTLQDFQNTLNRQLLSTLSRQIISDQFGEDTLTPGTYSFGNLNVDVINTVDGVLVTVLDIATGEVTELLVPFF